MVIRDYRTELSVSLRSDALAIAHKGHSGEVMMKRVLREKSWWLGMDKDIRDKLRQCRGGTVVSGVDRPQPMTRKVLPKRAWQEIAIDFLCVPECGTTFLVVVDYYSRHLTVRK